MALLEALGKHVPTALLLEDVHWADEATLDVLRIAARRIEGLPALVVATYRDEGLEAAHPLRVVLGELATNRAVSRLRLAGLSLDAVTRLADASDIDARELHRITGGNAFFVTEVLASSGEAIPETVRDAVLGRAARLSREAARVLEAVAIAPPAAELWLLESVVGSEGVAAIDECLACGMLMAGPTGIAFRHELQRLAVESSLAPATRLDLNRRALAALSARPRSSNDLARLAYHAEAAQDAARVLELAPAAASYASAHGAHFEAAEQYARALRFSEVLPPENRARLLNGYSFECYLTAQDEPALSAISEAVACYRELGDEAALGATLRWQGLALLNFGSIRDARESLLQAVTVLEPQPPGQELAMAYNALGALTTLDEDAEEAVRWSEQALELADGVGSTEARVSAIGTLGLNRELLGSGDGFSLLEDALSVAKEARLENQAGRAYVFLGMAASRERSLVRMREVVSQGLAYCEERDLAAWEDLLLAMQSWLELEECAWDDASTTVSQVLARRCMMSSAQANLVLGLLRARRGDPDPWTPLDAAGAVAESTGQLWWTYQAAAAKAEAAWLEGRLEVVREVTEAPFAEALERRAPWPMAELGLWRRRAGDDVDIPEGARGPFALQLHREWASAAEAWTDAGCPYEAALALADGDEDAQRRALESLNELGARPAADLVARRLRDGGARGIPRGPRPTTKESAAGLTQRETEVLRLLALGLRNREIADRLVVSQRTVDHHVSSILRKLDVDTRVGAAAEATRLGLLQDP
jgi:DNA-binding CsgD family transcriptional regulator